MKHITFADKSLMLGDETADAIVAYAAALANAQKADTVEVHGYSSNGEEVDASFVLTTGTNLLAETVHTTLEEPENTAALRHMRDGMTRLHGSGVEMPNDSTPPNAYVEFDL